MTTAAAPARLRGGPWPSFAARRLARFAVSLWALVTAAFLMIHLVPGDPVRAALGMTAPAELVRAKRLELGLDDPLWVQYGRYLRGVFTGDFGTSMASGQPVTQVIGDRLPATLQLAIPAFAVVVAIAIPVGVVFAVLTRGGRRRGTELAFTSVSAFLAAVPEFLAAVALVALFAVVLGWFPVAGSDSVSAYVLPVAALVTVPSAVLARMLRVELLAVLGADFVRTARAKRLPARLVYVRHALPNALTATLTLGGLMLTGLVAGTVLVENVFAWPGLGSTIVQSILQKDYPLVQGIVLVYGVGVLLVNLLVDVVLGLLDPRSAIREA